MIPLRDDNPHFITPYVTYAILALNVAAWVFLQGFGTEPMLSGSVCRLGLIPGELLQTVTPGTRLEIGPNTYCVLGSTPGWHTLVTSMFMHGSWFHLIGNMWFLWIFGNNVEDSMGHARFVAFYLLSGLAAAAAQILADMDSAVPMVGASGAIGGVMGGYIVLYPRVRVHMLVPIGFILTTFAMPAFLMLGYWLAVQLISGFLSLGAEGGGVAFWAHIGGFVTGAVLAFLFKDPQLVARHPYYGWNRPSPTRGWHRYGR